MSNSKIFIFKQSNKLNWSKVRDQLNLTLNDIFRSVSFGDNNKDFEIEIRQICQKRSGQQLKGFWILIESVRKWMNSKGNLYTKEEVAEYFKRLSGHCTNINGVTVGKSIANKSDCTKEEMEALITEITKFGAENDIEDCFIEPKEFNELLKYYEDK